MENTDLVIEHIDEEVKVIADQPSVVTNYPANTDFFIENIDSNVISIAHSLNIEASEVDFRPANTDFFIENIDKNVIAIAESMSLTPSEVDFRPANTDFFVENIDKNLIEIAESLSLTPYEVTTRPANTDMFIENIDKNVTLIKGSTNVVTVSGEHININLPDGGKVQSAQIDGNATQTGTPTPNASIAVKVVTEDNTVVIDHGKNIAIPQTFINWINLSNELRIKYNWQPNNPNAWSTYGEYDGRPHVVGFDASLLYTVRNEMTNPTYTEFSRIYTGIFKENTRYTISFEFMKTGGTAGSTNLKVYYTDGTYSSPVIAGTAETWSELTHTTVSGKTVSAIAFTYASGHTWLDLDTLQIEEGITATDYEPYQGQVFPIDLGELELAGVGEIQPDGLPKYHDQIKKNLTTGKWYVEKQVGKVVLDGTETWSLSSNANLCRTDIPDALDVASSGTIAPAVSDYFTASTWGSLSNGTVDYGLAMYYSAGRIALRNKNFTTRADYTTWLGTHNTTVYYALATPTTTEITDQTLIDQLEALASATLNQGVNNIFTEIATGNAMPTLKLVIEKY